MAIKQIEILKLITLLDSICIGLTYPFVSTYIQSLGADHIVVGVLTVGCLLCNLVLADFVPLLKAHCRQFSIVVLLLLTALSHLCLIATSNYWHIIFGRYVISTVKSHIQNLCKDLLLQKTDNDEKEYILTLFNILSDAGYIIGPIIAGYLFQYAYVYIGLLAVVLSFFNFYLSKLISTDDSIVKECSDERATSVSNIYQNLSNVVDNCKKADYEKNWDIMAVKLLYVSCVAIFYNKFAQLLNYNYHSSPVAVGYTYAYLNCLTFASAYSTIILKDKFSSFSPIILAENSLKFLGACLFIACYSPFYSLFMIMCIPITFSSTFISSIWRDLFATRKNDSLDRLIEPLKIAANLATPLAFGILCNIIGHHAVIAFCLIPVIISICIINFSKRINVEQTDKKTE